jgi:hypothetical protein
VLSAPSDAWKRLGALLVQRRIELAPRYRKRTAFADDVGIKWRLLYDIERAKRDSFTAETLAAVEVAYQWQRGSVMRVLAGGDPLPWASSGRRQAEPPRYSDPALQHIWETPGTTEAVRLALVAAAIAMRELNDGAGSRSA